MDIDMLICPVRKQRPSGLGEAYDAQCVTEADYTHHQPVTERVRVWPRIREWVSSP